MTTKIHEVVKALAADKISRTRARWLLDMSSYDHFPSGEPYDTLTDEQRAPLHTLEQVATLRATEYFFDSGLGNYFVQDVQRAVENSENTENFRVFVAYADENNWNNSSPRGYLLFSKNFELLDSSQLKLA